jgi:hypothetical protein
MLLERLEVVLMQLFSVHVLTFCPSAAQALVDVSIRWLAGSFKH